MNSPIHRDPTDAQIEQGLLDSRRLEDAPESAIQRAFAAWRPRRQGEAAPGLLQRVLATLSFDSGAAPSLAFGQRSGGGSTRQLLFTAQGHDVDLCIVAAGDPLSEQWQLMGQVLGPQASGNVQLAIAGGTTLCTAELSDLGEFRLPAVPPGDYALTLRLRGKDIVLPVLRVPQPG